jgi:hypothetical protein
MPHGSTPNRREEAVTRRDPPREKDWEVLGDPRRLIIGAYRIGCTITPFGNGTRFSYSSTTAWTREASRVW